jgi:hypothetical protein
MKVLIYREKKSLYRDIVFVFCKILINISRLGCCFRQECVLHSVGLPYLHLLLSGTLQRYGV